MKSSVIRKSITVCAILIMVFSLTGCVGKMLGRHSNGSEAELVIPDFPTAREQFAFAKMYQQSQLTSPELDKRRVQMDKVAQYYNRVLVNFPNDPVHVPLTYLELGDCAAQSDYFDQAIQAYQAAGAGSQDEFVVVRSQYSIARVYDTLGRHVEAKAIYKKLMDEHKNTQSGRVKDVLRRAYQNYVVVQKKAS